MGRLNKSRKRPRLGRIGRARHSTPIYDDLLDSPAYSVLTSSAKILLIEVLRRWCRKSAWDTAPASDGIPVTWDQCGRSMSEKTFRTARKALVTAGFLDVVLDPERKPGAPVRYVFGTRWQSFEPDPETARKQRQHAARKAARIDASARRLMTFWQSNAQPNGKKTR